MSVDDFVPAFEDEDVVEVEQVEAEAPIPVEEEVVEVESNEVTEEEPIEVFEEEAVETESSSERVDPISDGNHIPNPEPNNGLDVQHGHEV